MSWATDFTWATYFQQQGAEPLPPTMVAEEQSPDIPIATESNPATQLTLLSLPPNPQIPPCFRFFVDGVQRTVPVAEANVNGIRVPIHLTHIIAGAMRRENQVMSPILMREATILLIPYQALLGADHASWGQTPPGQPLGVAGNIYGIVQGGQPVWSDTSISMRQIGQQQGQTLLQPGDLVRTGAIRRSALDRATELMRVLELGVIWELRQQYPDDWILLDGPIAPLTKYARLVVPQLQGLQQIQIPQQAFEFLRRIVGAIKEVKTVPTQGLEVALQPSPNVNIPIYRFSQIVQQVEDDIAREILSGYIWLRRELVGEVATIWSSASGLARFDVPLPAILSDDPQTRHTWNFIEDDAVAILLQQNGSERLALQSIFESLLLERWPVPSTSATRMLVELYPIAETELWLSASLPDIQEIRARGWSY